MQALAYNDKWIPQQINLLTYENLKFLGQWFLVLMSDGQEVNDLYKESVFFSSP